MGLCAYIEGEPDVPPDRRASRGEAGARAVPIHERMTTAQLEPERSKPTDLMAAEELDCRGVGA
jgi:hypothetical protein